jgi:hypothetical protein
VKLLSLADVPPDSNAVANSSRYGGLALLAYKIRINSALMIRTFASYLGSLRACVMNTC